MGQFSKERQLQQTSPSRTGRQPLPILYVIGSLDVGGAERHLARVVPALDRERWAPAIYTFNRRGDLADAVERSGVPVYSPRIPAFLRSRNLLSRMMRLSFTFTHLVWHLMRNRPCLVHYFLPASYLIGLPATFLAHALTVFTGKLPLRVMSRRSLALYQRNHPVAARLERLLHRGCSAVIGNSRAVIAELEAEGVRPEQLQLIYNGIETPPVDDFDKGAKRAELGLSDDSLVIVQVANLIPYKGHADLLEAFAKLSKELDSEIVLCLVGRDDGIGAELASKARALGIGEQVRWLGVRDDVSEILAIADIGVLSSHQEGFSNAVLEGMAAGLPMVVTRVGGNPEAIIDGETGLIVSPSNPHDLAEAMGRLAKEPTLRRRFGAAALARQKRKFSLKRCLEGYERVYAALCDANS